MRTPLVNTVHSVLNRSIHPAGLVLSSDLTLLSWRRPEITGGRCVSCIAVSYGVQKGSQS
jgi:hypothetical protein